MIWQSANNTYNSENKRYVNEYLLLKCCLFYLSSACVLKNNSLGPLRLCCSHAKQLGSWSDAKPASDQEPNGLQFLES